MILKNFVSVSIPITNTRGNHHARYENTDITPVSQATSDDVPPPPPSAGAAQGSDITAHSADTSNTQGRKILIDSANYDSM